MQFGETWAIVAWGMVLWTTVNIVCCKTNSIVKRCVQENWVAIQRNTAEIQQKYRTGAYEIQRGTYTVAFQIGGPVPIRASTNVLGLRFQTPGASPSLSSITVMIKMISLSCWLFLQLIILFSKVNISKWQQSFAICQGRFKRLMCNSTSACFQQSLQLHPISLFISSFKSRKCNISAVVFPLKYLQS